MVYIDPIYISLLQDTEVHIYVLHILVQHCVIHFQERRPFLATECDDLKKAEKFRRQIIGEISKKVAQIQNGLSRHILKYLHDIHLLTNIIVEEKMIIGTHSVF